MHRSGHEYQASVFRRKSSPIIHELFNDCSCCNEQSYSGEKCLPSPGIEPKTFHFRGRRSNHWATRLGWLNKEKLRHTTCNCAVGTSTGLCNGDNPGHCKWQLRMWHVVQHIILALSVQALLWQGLLGKAVRYFFYFNSKRGTIQNSNFVRDLKIWIFRTITFLKLSKLQTTIKDLC